MDPEKQKRNQLIKVFITEILMVLAIIPIVMLLTLLAMGYRLGEDMSLEQTGLVQVNSLPSGATVMVDGLEKFRTDASRMLSSGEHHLEITKEGFDSWSKKISVTSGLLLRIRYPRLFRKDRQMETVSTLKDLKMLSAAPSRTRIMYQLGNSAQFKMLNIRNNDGRTNDLDLSEILRLNEAGEFIGTISKVRWSWNSDTVLAQVKYDDGVEWILIDMRENVPNRNLTKDFGLAIDDAQFEGDSTERIHILENGNLRELNLSSNGISRVLLDGVIEFFTGREYVSYVGQADGLKLIGLYRNGDDGPVIVAEAASDAPAHAAVNEYYGEKYFTYTLGEQLVIFEGENLPTYGGNMDRMHKIIDANVGVMIDSPLIVNRTGEVIIALNQDVAVVVDLETRQYKKYEMPVNTARFIDDYLLYGVIDGGLYVWDFDGDNKRLISEKALSGFDAVISANNHWLYYVTTIDDQLTLVKEKID